MDENLQLAEDRGRLAESEKEARRAREAALTDAYTSFGLMADGRGDPAQAVLWFANVARLAGDDAERSTLNRLRARVWSRHA